MNTNIFNNIYSKLSLLRGPGQCYLVNVKIVPIHYPISQELFIVGDGNFYRLHMKVLDCDLMQGFLESRYQ